MRFKPLIKLKKKKKPRKQVSNNNRKLVDVDKDTAARAMVMNYIDLNKHKDIEKLISNSLLTGCVLKKNTLEIKSAKWYIRFNLENEKGEFKNRTN